MSPPLIFSVLAARIADHTYPSGHVLRISKLSDDFGTSRTPVREALQRLSRTGLIEIHPSWHTIVTETDPAGMARTGEVAAMQCGIIARLAAQTSTAEDRQVDAVLAQRAAVEVNGLGDWLAPVQRVFTQLSQRAENPIFDFFLEDYWYVLVRDLGDTSLAPVDRSRVGRALTTLASALQTGDAHLAEAAARYIFAPSQVS